MLVAVAEITNDGVMNSVEKLLDCPLSSAMEGKAVHEVELRIFHLVLALGRMVFGQFLALHGTGDVGEGWVEPDGRVLKRLPRTHPRTYQSVFGSYVLERTVYGSREGQKIEFVPLDARLQLPEGEFSYVLQNWSQSLNVEHAYAQTVKTLNEMFGLELHVDSQELGSRRMAQSVAQFRQSLAPPPAAEEGQVLVVTADNKGVPMVRPAEDLPAGCRRKKGEKANKKQMATVGCVYTVDPKARTPDELIQTLFRERPASSRAEAREPVAVHKRVWSRLTQDCADEQGKAEPAVIGWLAHEASQRLGKRKEIVCVMDGQRTLWEWVGKIFAFISVVQILDLMHVSSRLWEAAHLFHEEGSLAAREFVRSRLLRILRGEVGYVIGGLRQMGSKHKLRGTNLKRLRTICNYLSNNRDRMHYDEYLAAGYPIASGVIEGACRYYIKDRMERAGMRWRPAGAQAILDLRATYINGQWDAFQAFRIERDTQRMYPELDRVQQLDWQFDEEVAA